MMNVEYGQLTVEFVSLLVKRNSNDNIKMITVNVSSRSSKCPREDMVSVSLATNWK